MLPRWHLKCVFVFMLCCSVCVAEAEAGYLEAGYLGSARKIGRQVWGEVLIHHREDLRFPGVAGLGRAC